MLTVKADNESSLRAGRPRAVGRDGRLKLFLKKTSVKLRSSRQKIIAPP